jgi:hypothetical protein
MSAPFSVFVCSTFDDLEQDREAVLDAIRRANSDIMRLNCSARAAYLRAEPRP